MTTVDQPAVDRPARWAPTRLVGFSIGLHLVAVLAVIAWPAWWRWPIAALLANHLLLGTIGMWPRGQLLGRNLARLPRSSRGKGHVALTFDDGPDPDVTPLVLEVLDRYGAKASFFCIGRRAGANPELVRDIVSRGHSVENHSFRHPYSFAFYLPRRLIREIDSAQAVLASITGSAPRFFRAPMGLRSPLLDWVLVRSALRHVSWTRRGWDTVSRNPAAVLRRLTRRLTAGDVILLHDGSCARTAGGDPVVLAVLPALLEHLANSGLRSVALPNAFPPNASPRS
jgi:peptidoglycan-N-acetylglucosamine deacetylase